LDAEGFENAEEPQPVKVIGVMIATAIRMVHRNALAEEEGKRIKASLILISDESRGAADHLLGHEGPLATDPHLVADSSHMNG
jgi:hypothetical protein